MRLIIFTTEMVYFEEQNLIKDSQPLVSVVTPTWTRADYLERVWISLVNQTYQKIEWLIADDGSTDFTQATVIRLSKSSKFSITLISASVHIGKARMDNELITHANGDFIFWNDSDDFLLPEAVTRLVDTWNNTSINEQMSSFIGIAALCSDSSGIIQTNNKSTGKSFITTLSDLDHIHGYFGDKLIFARSSLLKSHRFAEVDFMITESSLWNQLNEYKIVLLPEILRIMDRGAPNRISYSGKMEYCRGKAFGIYLSEAIPIYRNKSLSYRLWKSVTYFRYCIHGDINLLSAYQKWDGNLNQLLFLITIPFGVLFAIKDILQGKVVKTHRAFDKANKMVKINVNKLSDGTSNLMLLN